MLHTYNQQSFKVGGTDPRNPLLCLYCSLVVLELAIKDYLHQSGPWRKGHCIIDWLTTDLGETSLGTQLESKLSALYCTYRDGSEVNVDANRYPDIRYLRHETDFPGKSTDSQLKEALEIIKDIKTRLISRGIRL
uniref:HEPN domain-containing protein n=1 Tax=Cyanothece sp. (strain PCC 7425 / ATCC 29141) TaxID=395961 RepID=B8HZP8_CYAP4